jgi:hypothetical protein
LKHAFNESSKEALITVSCDVFGKDWKLVVVDNGIGKPEGVFAQPKSGLGPALSKRSRAGELERLLPARSGHSSKVHVSAALGGSIAFALWILFASTKAQRLHEQRERR